MQVARVAAAVTAVLTAIGFGLQSAWSIVSDRVH